MTESAEEPPPADKTLPAWRRRMQWPMLVLAAVAAPIAAIEIAERAPAALGPVTRPDYARRTLAPSPPFDLSDLTIPPEEVRHGGPPKDGIPALTDPAVVAASAANYLAEDDMVIGVEFGGEARAYPLAILDLHEIVNDTVGGRPIAVTYCPLCDSSVVFDRRSTNGVREFGVSGRLYNSNVLLYDRRDSGVESLWTQMGAVGLSGPGAGEALPRLPLEVTDWGSWKSRHPATTVLTAQTGHRRTYDRTAYAGYFTTDRLMFPVTAYDDQAPAKTPVLAVTSAGESRAYRISAGSKEVDRRETLGGASFDLTHDASSGRLRIENADPMVEWCYTFWFAWSAFHPECELVALD